MKSIRPMIFIMLFTLFLGAGVTALALNTAAVRFSRYICNSIK